MTEGLLALLEETAFEQITIQDIVQRAGIGYATFFRHFADKQALLERLAADEIRGLIDLTLPVLASVDARASALALCAYIEARRTLWSALLTGGAAAILREEFIRQTNLVGGAVEEEGAWPPRDLIVPFAIGGVLDILTWWLRQDAPVDQERVAVLLADLVIAPLVSSGGKQPMERLRRKLDGKARAAG
ncbi:TetR/AcrR family transcriptional regulator [Caulobacter sp. BK020]|uniref:TetR/AcrR family transcriptional regulator n=1 Tax=Caulobacter sp. BK020 TaxID=2512117 RepID=UPI001A9EF0EB|nr:TetR/AcrR family transcriptional regulator [Caulobacter sp. BK020]